MSYELWIEHSAGIESTILVHRSGAGQVKPAFGEGHRTSVSAELGLLAAVLMRS